MPHLPHLPRPGSLDYKAAGVDRDAADRLVGRITGLAATTRNRQVKSSIGGYASLYELDSRRWLAASTDGVGTKLKLAFRLGIHHTVGVDLVAMSVNDLLCSGATPLFFLDYFATGRLNPGVAEKVIEGIVDGCRQAGCALVGGETAEMPDMYSAGEYDLAGFAVGFLNPKDLLPRKDLKAGDALVAIGSSGFHSNGFSLLRKLIPEGQSGDGLARELMTPTLIYSKAIAPLLKKKLIKGLAHVTGSGFLNIPRISQKFSYEIEMPSASDLPPVIATIRERSGLPARELYQTFNMGVGMLAVVREAHSDSVIRNIKKSGFRAWRVGSLVKKRGACEIRVRDTDGSAFVLEY